MNFKNLTIYLTILLLLLTFVSCNAKTGDVSSSILTSSSIGIDSSQAQSNSDSFQMSSQTSSSSTSSSSSQGGF